MKRPIRSVLSKENLRARGVPKKFWNKSIADFNDYDLLELKELKEYVTDYLDNIDEMFEECKGILFYGSNGVGKTFLASLIVKEAYRHRYTSKRVTMVEYITEYTRIWGIKNPDEKEEIESHFYNDFKAVEFLVLEEIGKEIDTKVSVPILEDMLRYREDNGLVTIICSNLAPSAIKEKYGTSTLSLMTGNMTPVKVTGEDRRKEVYED